MRLRETDWAATPLGPVERWPEGLRAAVGMAMYAPLPMLIAWGPSLVQIYNDAMVPILGEKGPQFGRRADETWAEVWDVAGPMVHGVLQTNEAVWAEDRLVYIDRLGFPEDTYFSFSHSPILGDGGVAEGILMTALETTERLIDTRRMALVGDVVRQQRPDLGGTARQTVAAIGRHAEDLPFAALYLRDGSGAHRRAGVSGLPADAPGAPEQVAAGAETPWPLERAAPEPLIVGDVDARVGTLVHASSGRPVRDAALLRLGSHGTLVVGLSPTRRIDERHRAFLTLLGHQLEALLSVAAAITTEQVRGEQLLALDRAKSTFFSDVSHRLRNPVSLMCAPLADALEDHGAPLSGEQRERIALAHHNAERLATLVDDILDFMRDTAAGGRPPAERDHVGALTAELAASFAPAAARAGLALVVDCPEPEHPAWVDPRIWERVVLNLMTNAVRHTRRGSITVRLHDRGDRLRLEVRDTGEGIPADELERVFARAGGTRGATARADGGTGIGLRLVQRLVELQDGECGVESVVGEGSCFWAEIPSGEVPSGAALGAEGRGTRSVDRPALAAAEVLGWVAGLSRPETAPGLAAAARGQPRVLFADDNADMRAYVCAALAPEFAVRAVADGITALAVAREALPDLVLTDVTMPGLDGFGLLRALREDPATAGVPVVMLSARAGGEATVQGLDAGADDYLLKPFSLTEVRARVRSTIALARTRTALAQAEAERHADRRIVAAEERFRHAARAAKVGTWSLDLNTGEFEVDVNLEEMFGAPPGSLRTLERCMDYILPGDRARVRAELAQSAETVDETVHELRIVRPDGEERAFLWRASAGGAGEQRPGVILGAAWDATELLDAQAALRDSEQGAPSGIAIVELDGRVSRVNRALCELLGRPAEQLVGRPFAAFVHPDDDASLPTDPTGTHIRELRLVDAADETVWSAVSSAPVRAADGSTRHLVVHVQDARERKRFEGELQRLADHDSLTGLFNRRRFTEELERALAGASRYREPGALVMVDVDGLKHVNDTLGHAAGDELLIAVADLLRGRLRADDVVARLGGDEFAVILSHADAAAARATVTDLLQRLRGSTPLASVVGPLAMTASAGIALFGQGKNGRSGEDLLIEADIALYEAKDAGRGQLRTYGVDCAPVSARPRRRRWTERIRSALDGDRFVLHAQPIRSLRGDPLDRWELLLRMRSDRGPLLAPSSFMPTAERSSLIQEIDRWVVHRALAELAARGGAGLDTSFCVNLSARSITDPGMARFVVDELDAAGVDGRRVVFEVTETSAVINLEQARSFAGVVAEHGCTLALDDFGAGFTSFRYLQHLDFAFVKIDGEFITDLPRNPTNQSLVRALSEMARSLGKLSVAEFVGDAETVGWLEANGVDFVQGFHIGRPRPLSQLPRKVR